MPMYTFENTDTGEQFDMLMKIQNILSESYVFMSLLKLLLYV